MIRRRRNPNYSESFASKCEDMFDIPAETAEAIAEEARKHYSEEFGVFEATNSVRENPGFGWGRGRNRGRTRGEPSVEFADFQNAVYNILVEASMDDPHGLYTEEDCQSDAARAISESRPELKRLFRDGVSPTKAARAIGYEAGIRSNPGRRRRHANWHW